MKPRRTPVHQRPRVPEVIYLAERMPQVATQVERPKSASAGTVVSTLFPEPYAIDRLFSEARRLHHR